ncbi:MAG TPA: hypothetical protein VF104_01775 [Burkholderiales bacterium]
MKSLPCLIAGCALASAADATPPDIWQAHYQEVKALCLQASGLLHAKPAGEVVSFPDQVGYDALLLSGQYPQTKGKRGEFLCLFDRRSRQPYLVEAGHLDKPRKGKR